MTDVTLATAADADALSRFAEAACILTGRPGARAMDGAEWVHRLCAEIKIPALGSFGVTSAHLPEIAAASQKASSMRGNPVRFSDEELLCILQAAL